MDYQLEPNNVHVIAYSKMWLNKCSNCNSTGVNEKYIRIEYPPWSRTDYECIDCGSPVSEKSWSSVLEEYGDSDLEI